jgi:hypothetical protein
MDQLARVRQTISLVSNTCTLLLFWFVLIVVDPHTGIGKCFGDDVTPRAVSEHFRRNVLPNAKAF